MESIQCYTTYGCMYKPQAVCKEPAHLSFPLSVLFSFPSCCPVLVDGCRVRKDSQGQLSSRGTLRGSELHQPVGIILHYHSTPAPGLFFDKKIGQNSGKKSSFTVRAMFHRMLLQQRSGAVKSTNHCSGL